MLTHGQIWRAIDALAAQHGMSASGLAKQAGLDPTTFNKSKRGAANGKLRWPSTESLAKVLTATGSSLQDFLALISETPARSERTRMIPCIGFAQAGNQGCFNESGHPQGTAWENIAFPEIADEHCYALEISGDSMLPVYRDGDRILVSPSGSLRRGDRVIVKTSAGEVIAKQLNRMTAQRIELKSFNPVFEDRSFALGDVVFIHRIIWASQ